MAADTTNFKNYKYKNIVDKFPADLQDTDADTTAGDEAAAKYALKNLSSDAVAVHNGDVYTMKDNYTRGDPTITMTPSLYKDVNYNYYYVVHLKEDIHHFFLGFLDDMNAGVVSVARLNYNFVPPRPPGVVQEGGVPEGTNILAEMYKIEDVSAIRNWEWQDNYKNNNKAYQEAIGRTDISIYSGKWNEYQAKDKDKNQAGVHYESGKKYRTEIADVYAGSGSQGSSTGRVASYSEDEVDSLNLDFKADVVFKKNWDEQHWEDFDINYGDTNQVTYGNGASSGSANLRIHSTFNFDEAPYAKRASNKYDTEKNPEDVLYVRIESEPIWDLSFRPANNKNRSYSSVRQIILNINKSNMGSQYRPLMFFYAGPEKIDNNSTVRESQPIILNLNADARVILFAPNSPVIINGNGHKMQGFVIAKEFVQLTTAADYYEEDGRYYNSSAKTKEYFLKEDEHRNNLFTDEYGTVQTKPLSLDDTSYTRDPDYLAKLKDDSEHADYLEQFASDQYYLWNLKTAENSTYANCNEMPERADVITDLDYEKIYKMNAFNLSTASYYDSFQVDSLKRHIYTYLDNYYTHLDSDPENDKPNAVDMFFTTIRSGWVD